MGFLAQIPRLGKARPDSSLVIVTYLLLVSNAGRCTPTETGRDEHVLFENLIVCLSLYVLRPYEYSLCLIFFFFTEVNGHVALHWSLCNAESILGRRVTMRRSSTLIFQRFSSYAGSYSFSCRPALRNVCRRHQTAARQQENHARPVPRPLTSYY